jgi:hypothetical protein
MKTVLGFTLFLNLVAGPATASTLTTIPTSGFVTGSPGEDVGWGFSFTNESLTESLSFSQSFLVDETNPLLGIYTDLIGPQGGPDNFSVDIGETWSEGFLEASQQGLGFFSIDPNAVVGASDSGAIRVFYNFADGSPGSVDVPFTVTVTDSAPEPATGWTILIGCMFIGGWAIRERTGVGKAARRTR